MKKFYSTVCTRGFFIHLFLWCWTSEGAIASSYEDCEGSEYSGAWFTVLTPLGMEVSPARTEPLGGGAISVWLSAPDGKTEFYLFSPQWGGTPYEIFMGATSRRELPVIESQSHSSTQLELVYDNAIGRYSVTQSSDPVSHLTAGYRTETGVLTEDYAQKYECFLKSIRQYSD